MKHILFTLAFTSLSFSAAVSANTSPSSKAKVSDEFALIAMHASKVEALQKQSNDALGEVLSLAGRIIDKKNSLSADQVRALLKELYKVAPIDIANEVGPLVLEMLSIDKVNVKKILTEEDPEHRLRGAMQKIESGEE
jgi:hypothetical protein